MGQTEKQKVHQFRLICKFHAHREHSGVHALLWLDCENAVEADCRGIGARKKNEFSNTGSILERLFQISKYLIHGRTIYELFFGHCTFRLQCAVCAVCSSHNNNM